MDKMQFWNVIDASRNDSEGDPEAQLDALRERLTGLSESDIADFERIFSEYHDRAYDWGLWGAAYVIGGGCSDDGFMDFRGWLISRGEKAYEAGLADPDSLVDVVTDNDDYCQVEGFQYLASEAWEAKTGKSADGLPRAKLPFREKPDGEEWAEDALTVRFPRLSARFDG
ncbi:MAG: DUF4240 domain-containing protein [Tahibacter sp.]